MKVGDRYKIKNNNSSKDYWGQYVGKTCKIAQLYDSPDMCTVELDGSKFLTPTEWLEPVETPQVPVGQCYHEKVLNHPISHFKFYYCKKCGIDLGDA